MQTEPMPHPWMVYVLRCRDGSLYCGISNNVTARLRAHQNGRGARYTRSHPPEALMLLWETVTQGQALREERWFKGLSRAEKLKLTQDTVAVLL